MQETLDDIFAPHSQQEKEDFARIQKESAENIKRVTEAAQACLSSELFHSYRFQYQNAEKRLVDVMIRYTRSFFSEDRGDMSKYGAMMARYITKLDDMRMMLKQVENDSRRSKKQGEKNAI